MDLKQKHITVPSLTPGDVLTLVAKWTITKPLAANHAWFEYSFGRKAIIEDERLEVDTPAALSLLVRTAAHVSQEQNGGGGRLAGDRRIYRWQTSNLSTTTADDLPEPGEPPPADVRMTTFRTWDQLSQWMGPLLVTRLDPSVRAKALELTKGLTDRAAQIDALYKFVALQIRYVSLSFGIGRYAPHPPEDVLRNQYGDCKDKHGLLAAMLLALGIDARPVLLHTGRSISEDVPSPSEFNHVITFVPGEAGATTGGLWLDTTTEVSPAGLLDPVIRDKRSLLLEGERGRLVTTPADGPFPFVNSIEVDGRVSPLGVFTGRVRAQFRGDAELVFRSALRVLPMENRQAFAESFAKGMGVRGTISDISLGDPTKTDTPLEISFSLRKSNFLDWTAQSSELEVPTAEAGLIDVDDDGEVKKDEELGSPKVTRYRTVVELPPGYSTTAPLGIKLSKGGFHYESTYVVRDRQLTVERTTRRETRKLLVTQRADYATYARAVSSDRTQRFSLRRSAGGTPEIPSNMSATELYAAGYSAFEAKQYEVALTLWKKTAEIDPKMSSAWSGLGSTYIQLRRHTEAIAAYDEQIRVDPSNKTAHSDLGFAHKKAGNLEAAAKAYARHVEMNPLDGAAHKRLGEVYVDLNNHIQAVRALDQASALLKTDAWVHERLGMSYLELKQIDRARSAFKRALELSDTAAVWTNVSWELASHGLDPATVMELSGRTIRYASEGTETVRASDLTADHFLMMERLAWSWDARGLVALHGGDHDSALKYFQAAWKLGAESDVAEHLGQVYEEKGRMAESSSAYLTARALTKTPSKSLQARMAKLSPNADLEKMYDAASREAVRERTVTVPSVQRSGKGEFHAVLDRTGRVIDTVFVTGDGAVQALGGRVSELRFPIEMPGGENLRLVARIRLVCSAGSCLANLQVPRMVDLSK